MTNKNATTVPKAESTLAVARLLIDGKWTDGEGAAVALLDKYSLQPAATVTTASRAQVEHAIACAQAAFRAGAPVAFERGAVLERAAGLVQAREADFVRAMQTEAGFTASDAAGEVRRCVQTLKLSAEEARRLAGDVIPLAGAPQQGARIGFTLRVPLGVVLAITPFNSPLNTVAHKLAPAFAAGNAVVLKPSTNTPLTGCLLAQVLIDAGLPSGFLSVIHGSSQVAGWLIDDARVRFIAFTGSTEVGRSIQQSAGLRRTQMELGSIAFTIVCDDARLDGALPKIVNAGYRKAGQVCTSMQMLLVHESIADDGQRATRRTGAGAAVRRSPRPEDGGRAADQRSRRDAHRRLDPGGAGQGREAAGGRRAQGLGAAADAARRRRRLDEGRLPRDLRAGRVHRAVSHAGRGDRAGQRDALRPGDRRLHQPARRRARGGAPAGSGRRAHQRDLELARGHDALRRLEGQRLRPRGPALRGARNDRGTDRDDHNGEPLMSKKLALIFGGSRGIGAACVHTLAGSGFDVAYTFVSSAPGLPEQIGGARTKGYRCDIREPAQVVQAFADVSRDFGGAVHCVIANAGINVPPAPIGAIRS